MTDIPSSSPTRPAHTPLRSLVNIGCLVAIAIWAIPLVLMSLSTTRGPALSLAAMLSLLFGTPVLFACVLPAFIYNRWGGPSGPKVGAGLLLAALAIAVAIVMLPSVVSMFR